MRRLKAEVPFEQLGRVGLPQLLWHLLAVLQNSSVVPQKPNCEQQTFCDVWVGEQRNEEQNSVVFYRKDLLPEGIRYLADLNIGHILWIYIIVRLSIQHTNAWEWITVVRTWVSITLLDRGGILHMMLACDLLNGNFLLWQVLHLKYNFERHTTSKKKKR